MKTPVIAAALLALFATSANADTLYYRTDSKDGQTTHSYAVMTPTLEVWAFSPETKYSDLEIGRLYQVKSPKATTLMLGGYYAIWPNQKQSFAVPYMLAKATVGRMHLAGTLGSYVPLNGGPNIIFSDEASALVNVDKKVQVGIATSFWTQDGSTTHRIGPKVSADIGEGYTVSLRYLQGNAPSTFRCLVTKAF
jgi:hypothetical protein